MIGHRTLTLLPLSWLGCTPALLDPGALPAPPTCDQSWRVAVEAERRGARAQALRAFEIYAACAVDPHQRQQAEQRAAVLRRQVGILALSGEDVSEGASLAQVEAYVDRRPLIRAEAGRFYFDRDPRPGAPVLLFEQRPAGYARWQREPAIALRAGAVNQLRYAPTESTGLRFAGGIGVGYERAVIASNLAAHQLRLTLNLEHRWRVNDTHASIDLVVQVPLLVGLDGRSGGVGVALGSRAAIRLPSSKWMRSHDIAPVLLFPFLFEHHPYDERTHTPPPCAQTACTSFAIRPAFLLSYAARPSRQWVELRAELGFDVGVFDTQLYPPRALFNLALFARFPWERHLPVSPAP